MDIDVFSAEELENVFRVLRTALNPNGPLQPGERKFLETYSRITGYSLAAQDPLPIRPEEACVDGAHRRKRLVQLAAIAALFTSPVRPASMAFVRDLATSLTAFDPVIPVLEALADGRRLKARLLTTRRGMRVLLKEAYLAEGFRGVARFLAAMAFNARVNKAKLWSYKKLGLLPEGTLGREYWKHITKEGFGFPGEIGGIPDAITYHDVSHVLNGYETNPAGEIQQGSFQGGNRREDGFFFIQFVILQFHQGIKLTPIAKPEVGYFDPASVLWAIHRGAMCNVDVTHQWNHWPLMPLTLEEARQKIGLLPKLEAWRGAA
ncbi:MAG TPA: hypothetical protein VE755_07245 [Myxococcales bacterium]|nr:hypothetical protein [Myxococcales bacterium]